MARVVVVGGGFGGVFAVRALERLLREHEIILIEPQGQFTFTPLLHEVAGGVFGPADVTVPYREILRRSRHVRAAAERVDLDRKVVHAGGHEYRYEYLILAYGVRTAQAPMGALPLKTLQDAVLVRARMERLVRDAAEDPHVVVVGGGPTGVEVAGEAIDFLRFRCRIDGVAREPRVTLVHGRDRLLTGQDRFTQRAVLRHARRKGIRVILGERVLEVRDGIVRLGREEIRADLVVWTAGVAANGIPGVDAPVRVRRTLQIEGHPEAFAVGDASIVMEAPFPLLAQVASHQGVHAAHGVARLLKGKGAGRFSWRSRGLLVSVGQRWGAGRVLGVPVAGFPAWFLMRTIYLFKFKSVRHELRMMRAYTVRLFVRDSACVGLRAVRAALAKVRAK